MALPFEQVDKTTNNKGNDLDAKQKNGSWVDQNNDQIAQR